ncbi:MAG: hypothetical protein H7235_05285 [Bdellovibrionaceae bacterium]|nr:hypothetical protein [Pseudobdellovibrionaceae bacterium]
MYQEQFIAAIHAKTKIRLTFFSKEDNGSLIRLCSPMDYGPFRREKLAVDRYHLWDYESDKKTHNLAIVPGNVIHMEFLDQVFDPAEFITWACNWHVARAWGIHS